MGSYVQYLKWLFGAKQISLTFRCQDYCCCLFLFFSFPLILSSPLCTSTCFVILHPPFLAKQQLRLEQIRDSGAYTMTNKGKHLPTLIQTFFQCFFTCFVFTVNIVEVDLSKQTWMAHEYLEFQSNNFKSLYK